MKRELKGDRDTIESYWTFDQEPMKLIAGIYIAATAPPNPHPPQTLFEKSPVIPLG